MRIVEKEGNFPNFDINIIIIIFFFFIIIIIIIFFLSQSPKLPPTPCAKSVILDLPFGGLWSV